MQKRNLILRAAVVAAFAVASTSVFSTVTLTTTGSGTSAPSYASELLVANALLDNKTNENTLKVNAPVGWGVATSNHLYVRVDLTNAKVNTALTIASGVTDATGSTTALSAGGAVGDTYAIFDISSASNAIALTNNFSFVPDTAGTTALKWVDPTQTIGITIRYYTDSTLASSGGASLGTTYSGVYAKSAPALSTVFTPYTTTATVVSDFKQFGASTLSGGPGVGKAALLGQVATTLDTAQLKVNGSAVAAADLATGSGLVLTGDFTAAGTVTAGSGSSCASSTMSATLNTGKTTATFSAYTGSALTTAGASTGYICYNVTGSTVVPVETVTGVQTYTGVVLGATISNPTGTVGNIIHDGTTMVSPLIQTTAGWLSRLVLNNSGSLSRTYTVTALGETGNTVTLSGAAASGTLAAGSTTVIDLPALVATTGSPRTALKVVVAGPQSEIDGLYQVVNPTAGSLSNHVLSYK